MDRKHKRGESPGHGIRSRKLHEDMGVERSNEKRSVVQRLISSPGQPRVMPPPPELGDVYLMRSHDYNRRMVGLEAAMQHEVHGAVGPSPPIVVERRRVVPGPEILSPAAAEMRNLTHKVDEFVHRRKRVTQFMDQHRQERMDDVEDDTMQEYYRRNYGKTRLKRHVYERDQDHISGKVGSTAHQKRINWDAEERFQGQLLKEKKRLNQTKAEEEYASPKPFKRMDESSALVKELDPDTTYVN